MEQGEVPPPSLDHQSRPDRPHVLWPQWWFGSDQLALIPGRTGLVLRCCILRHGATPRLLRTGSMRAGTTVAADRCQLSDVCGHRYITGRYPVLPVLTLSRLRVEAHFRSFLATIVLNKSFSRAANEPARIGGCCG